MCQDDDHPDSVCPETVFWILVEETLRVPVARPADEHGTGAHGGAAAAVRLTRSLEKVGARVEQSLLDHVTSLDTAAAHTLVEDILDALLFPTGLDGGPVIGDHPVDRRVLRLGEDLDTEARRRFFELAAATAPPPEHPTELMMLATYCAGGEQPAAVPEPQTRAVINLARFDAGLDPLDLRSPDDVLRLAYALSGHDTSLATHPRWRRVGRDGRRRLLEALDRVVAADPLTLHDVVSHRARWVDFARCLHPDETRADGTPRTTDLPHAKALFAIARHDRYVPMLVEYVDTALQRGDTDTAAHLLVLAPRMLTDHAERVLRADPEHGAAALAAALRRVSRHTVRRIRRTLAQRPRAGEDGPPACRVWTSIVDREVERREAATIP